MAFFNGSVGNLWWSYFHGVSGPAEWAHVIETVRQTFTSANPGDVLLTVVYRHEAPTALQRKALADVFSAPGAAKLARHAVTTDSTLALAVTTALSWIGRKPWAERSFADPREAVAWLAEGRPGVGPDEAFASVRSVVPAASLWPALAPGRAER